MNAWVLFRIKHTDKNMGLVGCYPDYNEGIIGAIRDNGENEIIGAITRDADNGYHHIRMDTHFPGGIRMVWTSAYYLYEVDLSHILQTNLAGV